MKDSQRPLACKLALSLAGEHRGVVGGGLRVGALQWILQEFLHRSITSSADLKSRQRGNL